MHKLMTHRATVGLASFFAGLALGGSGLLATAASRNETAEPRPHQAAPFFYDLEGDRFQGRDPKGRLRLMIEPVRYGKVGLLVRVAVWNTSIDEHIPVHPICPAIYRLSFRTATGHPVDAYRLPAAYYAPLDRSELSPIQSGNCLSTSYLLPTFYSRISLKNLECQVHVDWLYKLDERKDRERFRLSSDWVKVPPP